MVFVARDFNTSTNHIGEMIAYLSTDINDNKIIAVDILNLHGLGQVWIRIKYDVSIDLYNTILSIFNKLTMDIYQEKLEKGQAKGIYKVDPEYTGFSITPKIVIFILWIWRSEISGISYGNKDASSATGFLSKIILFFVIK